MREVRGVLGAADETSRFHDWDRAMLAEMTWEWTADRIDISVHGADGTSIDLKATVDDSAISHVLEFTQQYLPKPIHRRMWGRNTETGTFGHLKATKVRVITEATACISDTLLGTIQPPKRPITFGDVSAFDHSFSSGVSCWISVE